MHVYTCASSRRFGQVSQRGDVLRRPGRAQQLGAEALPRGGDDLDGIALGRDTDDPLLVPLQHGDDLRQRVDCSQRPLARDDDDEARGEIAAATRIAGRLAAERRCDLAHERTRSVQQHPAPWARRRELGEPGFDARRRLRPDPGHRRERACGRGFPQLRHRPNPERVAELPHSIRREPEQPRDADELRQGLVLQLAQLCEVARLDELLQPAFDPRPDAGELARPSRPHERLDVGGSRSDQLGGATIRAHGVGAGPVQVEQRRERLQPVGKGAVVHD